MESRVSEVSLPDLAPLQSIINVFNETFPDKEWRSLDAEISKLNLLREGPELLKIVDSFKAALEQVHVNMGEACEKVKALGRRREKILEALGLSMAEHGTQNRITLPPKFPSITLELRCSFKPGLVEEEEDALIAAFAGVVNSVTNGPTS